MPAQPLWDLLAQLAGRQPLVDPGGGAGPGVIAPGSPYPQGGAGYPPDTGFDLWRGPGGYYSEPNPSFYDPGQLPPAPYVPPAVPDPWTAQGGPLDRWQGPFGNYAGMLPSPQAQVWGAPVLPDAFRAAWLEDLRAALERSPWTGPRAF